MAYYESMQELIGGTPIVRLGSIELPEGIELYAKLEYYNPAGSVKDRVGKYMVEETGMTAEKFIPLGVMYPTPGYSNEGIYMFLAENAIHGQAKPDEDEFLDTVMMPFDKALYQSLTGAINDAKTVICLARADLRRRRGKQ